MSPKYALQYILEKLKDRAKLALKDPKLIEIAKTAPLNAKREPNLTWVYDKAFYMLWDKFMIKKSRELATSTRFLAMLRRDYPEEFEKLIAEKSAKPAPEESKKEIPESPKKKFEDIKFKITGDVEIGISCTDWLRKFCFLKFPRPLDASLFCFEFLNKLNQFAPEVLTDRSILDSMIEILEKRGLKIKICGNCFYRGGDPISGGSYCREHPARLSKSFDNSCEVWKAPSKN